ncbi:sensor histidine kinase [Sphingobacterium corticis]|uniref:Sensor histidine kinase n=1 Tax=Sphingobacterium corticis TaxID=1812823 RepID=A0ABW5NPF4_9SPHI
MSKGRDTFLNDTSKRIIFVTSALLLQYLVMYLMDPFTDYWATFFTRPSSHLITDLSSSLLFCFSISESSIAIGNYLNRKISWTSHPGKRLALETAMNVSSVLLINQIICWTYLTFFQEQLLIDNNPISGDAETREMLRWVLVSIVLSLMIMGINIGNHLVLNWKNEAIRSAEYAQVAMEAELQSLKLQIDPHFVFNNLSVLSELILEDQQLGYEYAENFSRIYRYLLINAKKDVCTLKEEWRFLETYQFLIKQRFGDGIQFSVDVDPLYFSYQLPPLTLQLLVENALKHNKTSKRNPLEIRISTNELGELIVENTLLPLEKIISSSGIGLKNIIRRYKLLSQPEPRLYRNEERFTVVLPLFRL